MVNKEFQKEITVLLEPTAACNLRCRHCYHAKTEYDNKKMSKETFDRFLTITAPYYKKVKVIWHGGEPLLVGYYFFEYAYSQFDYYTQKYGTKFEFCIQTNGTLLDKKLIEIFLKTDTTISISYDGKYNDVLRQETKKVENIITLLKSSNIKFTCLSTISSASVNHLVELYEYFKKKGIQSKFNPILPDGAARENFNYIMTKQEWTKNFIELFRYWFYDKECNIYLSTCCDILTKYLGLLGNGCLSGTCMFCYIAINAYGNLYPCGRLIEKDYLIGNIYELNDIRQAYLSNRYIGILNKSKQRIMKCKSCKWFNMCNSGCNASANLNGDLTSVSDFECYFNRHVFEFIEAILKDYEISNINRYAQEILKKINK